MIQAMYEGIATVCGLLTTVYLVSLVPELFVGYYGVSFGIAAYLYTYIVFD